MTNASLSVQQQDQKNIFIDKKMNTDEILYVKSNQNCLVNPFQKLPGRVVIVAAVVSNCIFEHFKIGYTSQSK